MKNKISLFLVLGGLLVILFGTTIYVDIFAKSSKGLTYVLIAQMFIGIIASLVTLFIGSKVFENKKNYELLFISFLEVLFVLGLVVLNYVYGYGKAINYNDYIDYMGYVSMEFNIYIYMIFVGIIGLLTLNLFIKEKLNSQKNLIEEEKTAE